jgi:hypothetical protein
MPAVVLLMGLTEGSYGRGGLLFDHVITFNHVMCRRKPIGMVVEPQVYGFALPVAGCGFFT